MRGSSIASVESDHVRAPLHVAGSVLGMGGHLAFFRPIKRDFPLQVVRSQRFCFPAVYQHSPDLTVVGGSPTDLELAVTQANHAGDDGGRGEVVYRLQRPGEARLLRHYAVTVILEAAVDALLLDVAVG